MSGGGPFPFLSFPFGKESKIETFLSEKRKERKVVRLDRCEVILRVSQK